ncbi:MAG TPA: TolC family protein, partial [Saprospiraceae bacterium]|nr:TolC family protein [Saprospiraceae bacterium]
IGLTLNLFNILSQKDKNRIGRRDIEIAEQKVNAQMLAVRAETLTRYTQFRLAKDILKTRTLVEQETYNNFVLIQQLYKTDEKTFEDYSTASSAYYQAQEARIRAAADLQVAKLRLEEIIGLKWEQVQHPGKEE